MHARVRFRDVIITRVYSVSFSFDKIRRNLIDLKVFVTRPMVSLGNVEAMRNNQSQTVLRKIAFRV